MSIQTTVAALFTAVVLNACMVLPQEIEHYQIDPLKTPPEPTPVTVPAGSFSPENRPDALTAPPLSQRQLPVELTAAYGPAPIGVSMPPPPSSQGRYVPAKKSKPVLTYQRINALK